MIPALIIATAIYVVVAFGLTVAMGLEYYDQKTRPNPDPDAVRDAARSVVGALVWPIAFALIAVNAVIDAFSTGKDSK